jgi:hypothetical protein
MTPEHASTPTENSVGLLPAAKLNGERGRKLGELQHVVEAELVRNVNTAVREGSASQSPALRRKAKTHSLVEWMFLFESSNVLSIVNEEG